MRRVLFLAFAAGRRHPAASPSWRRGKKSLLIRRDATLPRVSDGDDLTCEANGLEDGSDPDGLRFVSSPPRRRGCATETLRVIRPTPRAACCNPFQRRMTLYAFFT